jgi:hypothetical protein
MGEGQPQLLEPNLQWSVKVAADSDRLTSDGGVP